MPDVKVEPQYFSRFAATLYGLGFIEDFGDDYIRRKGYQQINPRTFRLSEEDFGDFVAFMEEKEVPYESETRSALKLIKKAAQNDRFKAIEEQIEQLERELKDDTKDNLYTYRSQIEQTITQNIILRHCYERGVIEQSLVDDKEVQRAISLLQQSEEHQRILREQDTPRK